MKCFALALPLAFVSYGANDLAHTRIEFSVSVNLPYAEAAPLFGAWAEQKWAADWKPQFIYPAPPADQEGAVFKVEHGSHSSIWVNTVFDLPQGHVQYVYVLNNLLVTRIDIRLTKQGTDKTGASVVYERTALDAAANDQVRALGKFDSQQAPEWQAALDAYAGKIKGPGAK